MILAKVTGNVVSTHKNKELIGEKLLIVHPIDLEGNLIGNKDMIAIDQIDSGIGDVVLVTKEGDAVQQILRHANAPVNTIIVSVVDNIDLINEV